MFVNSVVNWKGSNYRILRLADNEVYLIELSKKTAKYVVKPKREIDAAVACGEMSSVEDPFAGKAVSIGKGRAQEIFTENYELVRDIVSDPEILFDKAARNAVIRGKTGGSRTKEQKIRRLLIAWWQKGQTTGALIPEYGKNFGKRLSGKTVGRRSSTGIQRKTPDENGRKLMDKTIKKYVFNGRNSLSLRRTYSKYLEQFRIANPGLTDDDAASFWQFKYFYRTNYTPLEKARGRSDSIRYAKDIRALRGTVYDIVSGIGSIYEIDSTLDNIYLVSSEDRTKVVGRPVLYVVADVYTGMIAGVDVKLENPQFQSAADALFIACSNKKELCAKYGVELKDGQWPIEGVPAKIVADNAELLGDQIEWFGRCYGVELSITPSRRPDMKATVERSIGLLQEELRSSLTGVPDTIKLKKAGGKDARLEASYTLEEYFKAVLLAVGVVNLHIRECSPDGYPDKTCSCPCDIYRWGVVNGNIELRDIRSKESLRMSLMKHYPCSFSREGAEACGIRYLSQEALKAGWFERNVRAFRPNNVTIVIDPGNVSTAYMFPDYEHDPTQYWVCTLAPKSARLAGKSMIEAQDCLKEIQRARALAQNREAGERATVGRKLDEIKLAGVQAKPKDDRSKARRVSDIAQNRHNERTLQERTNPRLSEKPAAQAAPSAEKEFTSAVQGYPDDFNDIFD